ncbi:MAG: sodium:proton antiporter NhaD [Saprospiraceae bacterium]
MNWLVIVIFVLGYAAIVFENTIRLNKAASALMTGVLCWTVYILGETDKEIGVHHLEGHLGEVSGILFFLLGAMVIVELVDAHDGFEFITERIKTRSKRYLLWVICGITFFLSAILDNLTTTIVMITLLRRLIAQREDRLLFVGMVVIAANAGGAWSPVGDVTTTMLWIGGQITPAGIIVGLFVPSLVCLVVPLLVLTFQLKGAVEGSAAHQDALTSTPFERNTTFAVGIGALLFVPVFKSITHLPPYMGILLGLGVMWMITEMINADKDEIEKGPRSVNHALRKIDTPSILFFLGILLAISALQTNGSLGAVAAWLDQHVGNLTAIGILIGLLSAIVDNVPLVAAAQGMYEGMYPTDHFFWELLAYCAGTGGSILIIGSAAGVAAMGMEQIDFFWYLKRISLWALIGYLAGVGAYVAQQVLMY